MTSFVPGPCQCAITGYGPSMRIVYCREHKLPDETRGDAIVLQAWMKENGCTPSMKTSECESLKNKNKMLQERVEELEWRIKALEKHIDVPRPGSLEYEIEQARRAKPYEGYKP